MLIMLKVKELRTSLKAGAKLKKKKKIFWKSVGNSIFLNPPPCGHLMNCNFWVCLKLEKVKWRFVSTSTKFPASFRRPAASPPELHRNSSSSAALILHIASLLTDNNRLLENRKMSRNANAALILRWRRSACHSNIFSLSAQLSESFRRAEAATSELMYYPRKHGSIICHLPFLSSVQPGIFPQHNPHSALIENYGESFFTVQKSDSTAVHPARRFQIMLPIWNAKTFTGRRELALHTPEHLLLRLWLQTPLLVLS